MNEHKAIARVHDKKRKSDSIDRKLVRVWKVRDDFTAGVLDCMYLNRVSAKTPPLYVEWKYVKALPKRATTIVAPKWNSAEQLNWANELHGAGMPVLIIIAFGEGSSAGAVILRNGEWNDGITTTEAKRRAIPLNKCATIIQRIATDVDESTRILENIESNFHIGK